MTFKFRGRELTKDDWIAIVVIIVFIIYNLRSFGDPCKKLSGDSLLRCEKDQEYKEMMQDKYGDAW